MHNLRKYIKRRSHSLLPFFVFCISFLILDIEINEDLRNRLKKSIIDKNRIELLTNQINNLSEELQSTKKDLNYFTNENGKNYRKVRILLDYIDALKREQKNYNEMTKANDGLEQLLRKVESRFNYEMEKFSILIQKPTAMREEPMSEPEPMHTKPKLSDGLKYKPKEEQTCQT